MDKIMKIHPFIVLDTFYHVSCSSDCAAAFYFSG
jgi:hypothetical protein